MFAVRSEADVIAQPALCCTCGDWRLQAFTPVETLREHLSTRLGNSPESHAARGLLEVVQQHARATALSKSSCSPTLSKAPCPRSAICREMCAQAISRRAPGRSMWLGRLTPSYQLSHPPAPDSAHAPAWSRLGALVVNITDLFLSKANRNICN